MAVRAPSCQHCPVHFETWDDAIDHVDETGHTVEGRL